VVAGAKRGSAMTAGTMVLHYSSSVAVLDHPVGWRVRHSQERQARSADRWLRSMAVACPSHDRLDEPSAAVPPGRPPIAPPARPLGNPAAEPLVTHPSCSSWVAVFPVRQIAMYAAALHRLPPPTRVEGARHSCADRCSPAGWPLSPSAAATPAIPFPPPRAPSSPVPLRNRVQRDPTQASHATNTDRDHPRRPAPPTEPRER
jgi:hypothetical protein